MAHVVHQVVLKLVVFDLVLEEHIIGKLGLLHQHGVHHGRRIVLGLHLLLLHLHHLLHRSFHVMGKRFHHLGLGEGGLRLKPRSNGRLKLALLGSHHELGSLLVLRQHLVS